VWNNPFSNKVAAIFPFLEEPFPPFFLPGLIGAVFPLLFFPSALFHLKGKIPLFSPLLLPEKYLPPFNPILASFDPPLAKKMASPLHLNMARVFLFSFPSLQLQGFTRGNTFFSPFLCDLIAGPLYARNTFSFLFPSLENNCRTSFFSPPPWIGACNEFPFLFFSRTT